MGQLSLVPALPLPFLGQIIETPQSVFTTHSHAGPTDLLLPGKSIQQRPKTGGMINGAGWGWISCWKVRLLRNSHSGVAGNSLAPSMLSQLLRTLTKKNFYPAQSCLPVIPALGRLRQENGKKSTALQSNLRKADAGEYSTARTAPELNGTPRGCQFS
jgi:hypothetical protein